MSIADELGKLNELRNAGALTDAEFDRQKATLLAGGAANSAADETLYADMSAVPLRNKWWFQVLWMLLLVPVGIVLMLFCKAYQKRKGEIRPVGITSKAILIVLFSALWAFALAQNIPTTSQDASEQQSEIATCESDDARGALKNAVEQNAVSGLLTLKLLDVRDIAEVSVGDKHRVCAGTLVLNTGAERYGYTLTESSDGDLLVEIHAADEPKETKAVEGASLVDDFPSEKELAEDATAIIKEFTGPEYGFVQRVEKTKDCYAGLNFQSPVRSRTQCLLMDSVSRAIEQGAPEDFVRADLEVDDFLSDEKFKNRLATNVPPLGTTITAREARQKNQQRLVDALNRASAEFLAKRGAETTAAP